MQKKLTFSRRIVFAVSLSAALLALMTIYRLFFFFHYRPSGKPFSGSAFLLGLRFDLRIVAVIALAFFLLSAIRLLDPVRRAGARTTWAIIFTLVFAVVFIFYGADYYYYDYLKERLSAAVLNFVRDAGISSKMLWQTYPLVRIALFLVLFVWVAFKFVQRRLEKSARAYSSAAKPSKWLNATFIILAGLAIFGKIGQYPLRWSDAFSLSDDFKAKTALNPFQSFLSTYSFKNSGYDLKTVQAEFPAMAEYLHVNNPDPRTLSLSRPICNPDSNLRPNVVVVICESFSAYKSSMFGNKLDPTPYFKSLCDNGVFFQRCFSPAFGTARGVWAVLTGIPDVEDPKTASRNPAAVNQHVLMNDFSGYSKYYFLGGSTTWANIRGLLTNNINGLRIYEESDFDAPKVDVWGISDKNLFLAANKVFATQTAPFVSVIQTADNHRPYTIPSEDKKNFPIVEYPADTLKKYGFDDNGQLNAFRYTDYCFRQFIEAAKKEKYFTNTIFVFVGDHGLRGDAGNLFPESFTKEGILAEHIPLLFYAPALLQPQKIMTPASQADIFPSVAWLAHRCVTNTGLGTNLFDSASEKNKYAFIADPDTRTIGVVGDSFYYARNLNTNKLSFVSVLNNDPVPASPSTDAKRKAMGTLTEDFYNLSKYLLLNNKKTSAQ